MNVPIMKTLPLPRGLPPGMRAQMQQNAMLVLISRTVRGPLFEFQPGEYRRIQGVYRMSLGKKKAHRWFSLPLDRAPQIARMGFGEQESSASKAG
jgi:hypothetical protein